MDRRAFLATVGTLPTVGCLGVVRREDSTARSGNPVRQSLVSNPTTRVGIAYAEVSADESTIDGVVVNFRDERVNVEVRAEFYAGSETAGHRFTAPDSERVPVNDESDVQDTSLLVRPDTSSLARQDEVLTSDVDGVERVQIGHPPHHSDAESSAQNEEADPTPSEGVPEQEAGEIISTDTYSVFGLAGRDGARFSIPFPKAGGPADGIEFRLSAVVTAVLRE